ncbi:hypothetical protein ACJQWK_08620 [Exserohilum turcicum]
MRYYIAWRHWACATKHQIQGLKETTENDPTKAPGYDALSPESQEQVRLAFEHGMPVDKQFKDIREDLAKDAPKYGQEYQNAMAYKVDLAARAAACRGKDCLSKQIKITKGELRLGILIPFDGEHASTVYKHWKCISAFDLANVTLFFERDSIEGVEELPEEVQAAVLETFQTGKIVEPPERAIEPPKAKAKKSRSKKSKASAKDGEVDVTAEEPEIEVEEAVSSSAPKAKKSTAKKRPRKETDMSSDAEQAYVPKKSRSRAVPLEEAEAPAEAVTAGAEEKTAGEA